MATIKYMYKYTNDIIRSSAARSLRSFKKIPKLPSSPASTNFARQATKRVGALGARMTGVIGAGLYGAHRIRKASKALNKTIESRHTKSSMGDHQRMLNRAQAKRKAKAAAASALRKSRRPIADYNIPGGQGTSGYDVTKWR